MALVWVRAATGRSFVNGQKVAEGRIEHTQCCFFSADEGTDVGMDEGTPVSEDYKQQDNKFTGKIKRSRSNLNAMKAANAEDGSPSIARGPRAQALAD